MQRSRCAADLTTLGTQVCGLAVRALLPLLSSTPAPRREARSDAAIPDGMVQLMAKLGMGRLPVLTDLALSVMPVGNAGRLLGARRRRWAAAPCRGSGSSNCSTPPSATRACVPSRRPCESFPRWRLLVFRSTRSATRASPPSWRRRPRAAGRCAVAAARGRSRCAVAVNGRAGEARCADCRLYSHR